MLDNVIGQSGVQGMEAALWVCRVSTILRSADSDHCVTRVLSESYGG